MSWSDSNPTFSDGAETQGEPQYPPAAAAPTTHGAQADVPSRRSVQTRQLPTDRRGRGRKLTATAIRRKIAPHVRIVVTEVTVDEVAGHAVVRCIDHTGATLVRDNLVAGGYQAAIAVRPERVAVTLPSGPVPRGRR